MAKTTIDPVTLEGARLIFRNFSGAAGKFNREGDRSFSVVLPENVATQMIQDGWNVKEVAPREEGEDTIFRIQVSVSYKGRPPRIVLISSKGRTQLNEDTIATLDFAEIENADLILNPYEWTVNDNHGIKAYLKSLFVTIHEDELELKYANEDMD